MKTFLLTTFLCLCLIISNNSFAVKHPSNRKPQPKTSQQAIQPEKASLSTISKLWGYFCQPNYTRMEYGASPAFMDLGPTVNNVGGEPNNYMEMVTGSDEYANFFPEINSDAYGLWRCFDALGNLEWARDTKSDEARTSVAIADIDQNLDYEIGTGTTSGWCVEVMNKNGSWTPGVSDAAWTFPYEPQRNGTFMWHSSPAIGELFSGPHHEGLEVVAGNNPQMNIWAFDGDNSDGVDDGITADISTWGYPGPTGTEGVDWDVLWIFQTNGSIIASPVIADVDGDGQNEVICGSKDSLLYCLNGQTGALKWSFTTGGMITSSVAVADFDNNGKLEIVVGSQDRYVYFIKGDLNNDGVINPTEVTSYMTGGPVMSSPAIADVNNDGFLEVLIGSDDANLYCFKYTPASNSVSVKWKYLTGSMIQSSPAIANSGRSMLSIYAGSTDSTLYILSGNGSFISSYKTNGPIVTSPSIADIDGDHKLEIGLTTWSTPDEILLLRDEGSNVTAFSAPWPMFRHDSRHTGFYNWVAPVYTEDVGVTEILEPQGTLMQGTTITPCVTVYNFGENTATNFPVTFEIRNDANTLIYTSTLTVSSLARHTSIQKSFPTLTATAGHFHSKAYTGLSGDQQNDDNTKTGTYQVIQSQWVLDFEADNGGFDNSTLPNGWEWGMPASGPMTAHSGFKLWATNLNGDYANSASWKLDSHLFEATQSNPVLSFWQWYNIENNHDGGNLKISYDGINWSLIFPVDGYPGIATWFNSGIPDEPCFSGASEGWKLTSFVLPVLTGQQFTLRWDFGSDNQNTQSGWYLDDVMGSGFQFAAPALSANVNLKVLLEGLYDPETNMMRKAQDVTGDRFDGTTADIIQIKLANAVYPFPIMHNINDVDLDQDGTCSFSIPSTGTYYLIVKHRNSIETWSAMPITFVAGANSYDFSTAANKAYGSNQKEMSDHWVIFAGDVNQDSYIDEGDVSQVDMLNMTFSTGYFPEDVNGDGVIDSGDLIMVDNNSSEFVFRIKP